MKFRYGKSGEKRKRRGIVEPDPAPIDVCKGQMWFLKRGPNVENNFFSWQIFLTLETVRTMGQWFNEGKALHKSVRHPCGCLSLIHI